MTFRVMSIGTMDHSRASGPVLRHGASMSPYACDRDEVKLRGPNRGLDAAELEGEFSADQPSPEPSERAKAIRLVDDPLNPYDRGDSDKPGCAAIVELRLPARSKKATSRSVGEAVSESDRSVLATSRPSTEAELWVEAQLKSAPTMTEDRWRQIANLVYRQTTSTRSGEKRPPLTAAGLITAAASTDSITARR